MKDTVYLTKEKYREIEAELNDLKTRGRREIAQKIADARSHGDLSENADYDAAKDEQGLLELKISKLSKTISSAQIIDPSEFPNDKIYILSKVKLKNLKTNAIFEYQLVSAEEANFETNKIGIDSPLGKAMMGKVVGNQIELNVPAGKIEYEVIEIGKP